MVGRVGNGAAEKDWFRDLYPGVQPYQGGPRGFGRVGLDHSALGCSLLPCGLCSRRDFAWRKRGERALAGGP